jgi:hypothetical protein
VRRTWTRRGAALFVAWAVVYAISAAANTDPQPLLLATSLAVLVAVVLLALDLSDRTHVASWDTWSGADRRSRGSDTRVSVLERALVDVATSSDVARVHPLLVELVDERLATRHGVDRAAEPDRAAELLGAELASFVAEPPAPIRFGDTVLLDRILTRIEAL